MQRHVEFALTIPNGTVRKKVSQSSKIDSLVEQFGDKVSLEDLEEASKLVLFQNSDNARVIVCIDRKKIKGKHT